MRLRALGVVGTLILLAFGCSSPTHEISGTVNYDGIPVAEGTIAFLPETAGIKSAPGQIADGQYRVSAPPGKFKVQINASKMMPLPRGQTGMGGAKEEVRQYIPAKYNVNTELKSEVPGTGPFNFELKSK